MVWLSGRSLKCEPKILSLLSSAENRGINRTPWFSARNTVGMFMP